MTALLLSVVLFGQCAGGSCSLPGASLFGRHPISTFGPGSAGLVETFYRQPAVPAAAYTMPTYVTPSQPGIVATPAPAQVCSLDDGHGWTWRHSDPNYLKAWVAGRKAALDSVKAQIRSATPCACCPNGCHCQVAGDCGRDGCKCQHTPPVPGK